MRSRYADSAARVMHRAIIALSAMVRTLILTAIAPMLAAAAAMTDAARKGMNMGVLTGFVDGAKKKRPGNAPRALGVGFARE